MRFFRKKPYKIQKIFRKDGVLTPLTVTLIRYCRGVPRPFGARGKSAKIDTFLLNCAPKISFWRPSHFGQSPGRPPLLRHCVTVFWFEIKIKSSPPIQVKLSISKKFNRKIAAFASVLNFKWIYDISMLESQEIK